MFFGERIEIKDLIKRMYETQIKGTGTIDRSVRSTVFAIKVFIKETSAALRILRKNFVSLSSSSSHGVNRAGKRSKRHV